MFNASFGPIVPAREPVEPEATEPFVWACTADTAGTRIEIAATRQARNHPVLSMLMGVSFRLMQADADRSGSAVPILRRHRDRLHGVDIASHIDVEDHRKLASEGSRGCRLVPRIECTANIDAQVVCQQLGPGTAGKL